MEINTAAHSTRQMLCEITTDPCAALIFAKMIQTQPLIGRPGITAPVERVRFSCFGLMGRISFENDRIITTR